MSSTLSSNVSVSSSSRAGNRRNPFLRNSAARMKKKIEYSIMVSKYVLKYDKKSYCIQGGLARFILTVRKCNDLQ